MADDEKWSEALSKKEIRKILGVSDENFQFYLKEGYIRELPKTKTLPKGFFAFKLKMHNMILERTTVFKYCFDDSFMEDNKVFMETVKHTSITKSLDVSKMDQSIIEQYQNAINNSLKKPKIVEHEEIEDELELILGDSDDDEDEPNIILYEEDEDLS